MIDAATLDRAPLLEPIGDSARKTLAEGGSVVRVPDGCVLWTAGSPCKGLHLLLSGHVRVVRGYRGRQHLVHVERPGGTLGEVPLFDDRGYPATAVTSAASEFIVLPPRVVHAAISVDPEFARLLLERLSGRVRTLVDRLHANTLKTVRARLAAFLLGEATLHEGLVNIGGTQAELAEDLGSTREVIARELSTLIEDGLISRLDARRYRIEDGDRLEALAE